MNLVLNLFVHGYKYVCVYTVLQENTTFEVERWAEKEKPQNLGPGRMETATPTNQPYLFFKQGCVRPTLRSPPPPAATTLPNQGWDQEKTPSTGN